MEQQKIDELIDYKLELDKQKKDYASLASLENIKYEERKSKIKEIHDKYNNIKSELDKEYQRKESKEDTEQTIMEITFNERLVNVRQEYESSIEGFKKILKKEEMDFEQNTRSNFVKEKVDYDFVIEERIRGLDKKLASANLPNTKRELGKIQGEEEAIIELIKDKYEELDFIRNNINEYQVNIDNMMKEFYDLSYGIENSDIKNTEADQLRSIVKNKDKEIEKLIKFATTPEVSMI